MKSSETVRRMLLAGLCLVLLNGVAWTILLTSRPSYTDVQCAELARLHREIHDGGLNVIVTFYSHVDRLLFRKPIYSGWGEGLLSKILIIANLLRLSNAWDLAAGHLSHYPGPTCEQSYRAGYYFVGLAVLQWMLIGAIASLIWSRFRRSRR